MAHVPAPENPRVTGKEGVARALLIPPGMLVEVVFHYRTLLGKSELGCGLGWDEIDQVTQIEHAFRPGVDDRRMRSGRRFRRDAIRLDALVRGDRINDRVEIIEMGPGGLVFRHAPYIARGEQIEIVIDIGDDSYRFRARGAWLKDDGDDYRVGVAFVGMPVCIRNAHISAHTADVVDKIAEAA